MSDYSTPSRFPDCPYMETTCFAFKVKGHREKCTILSDTNFVNREKCPFYKSVEQFEADKKKYPYNPAYEEIIGIKGGVKGV